MTWKIEGLLFENCNCQLICPAHVSFKQDCTYPKCHGFWGIHIREGHYQELSLSGLNAAVVFESGRRMYEGDWAQVFYIDARATSRQRKALESVLSGSRGGPWEILAKFVGKQLETRYVKMQFKDQGRRKQLHIDSLLEAEVVAIRARDDKGVAVLKDLFNQIHGVVHVLARGSTRCQEPDLSFQNDGSHGLYSDFVWED